MHAVLSHPAAPPIVLPQITHRLRGVPTAVTAFVGAATCGPVYAPTRIRGFGEFARIFGGLSLGSALAYAVRDFFSHGGREAIIVRAAAAYSPVLFSAGLLPAVLVPALLVRDERFPALLVPDDRCPDDRCPDQRCTEPSDMHLLTGLAALDAVDSFNLLCLPSRAQGVSAAVIGAAARYCEQRRALLLIDPPAGWDGAADALAALGRLGTRSSNAALFFPRLRYHGLRPAGSPGDFAPCGVVAGIFARTDAERGVWKAPAGLEATLGDDVSPGLELSDIEAGLLGNHHINCLRSLPGAGSMVWGGWTLGGAGTGAGGGAGTGAGGQAQAAATIAVRRTALFIEQSLERGLGLFEGERNDAALWARIRTAALAFMHGLFLEGAFQGRAPHEAYFVNCGGGSAMVTLDAGFAPYKAGQFVPVRAGRAMPA